ncbi:MAG: hypothetical protein OXF08_06860 [Bacteroidetes bacterium]|nr:hypothetical protein [Bacteroidota bacterium]
MSILSSLLPCNWRLGLSCLLRVILLLRVSGQRLACQSSYPNSDCCLLNIRQQAKYEKTE